MQGGCGRMRMRSGNFYAASHLQAWAFEALFKSNGFVRKFDAVLRFAEASKDGGWWRDFPS
jgi:hypothetical protein